MGTLDGIACLCADRMRSITLRLPLKPRVSLVRPSAAPLRRDRLPESIKPVQLLAMPRSLCVPVTGSWWPANVIAWLLLHAHPASVRVPRRRGHPQLRAEPRVP